MREAMALQNADGICHFKQRSRRNSVTVYSVILQIHGLPVTSILMKRGGLDTSLGSA